MQTMRFVTSAAAGTLTLVLAGCGGSEPSAPAAAPSAASSAAAAPTAAAPSSTGTEVGVTMTEFALELSEQEFIPGTYTFQPSNDGRFPHTITINGPGVDNRSAGGPAQGGQPAPDLTVDLQPGTYEIWCPVGDHKAKGMVTTVTVA